MNNALGRVPSQYAVLHGICKDASQTDPYVHSTKSKIICMGHLSLRIHPSPSSVAQSLSLSLAPWLLSFQDGCKTKLRLFLITKGNFTPLEGVCSVSGIPASSQFNPSLPSMPDHSSVKNYHCWIVIIRISLLCLSPLNSLDRAKNSGGDCHGNLNCCE